MTLEESVNKIDIFITATGNKGIIKAKDMSKMKNNAIVGNIGHFDNEVETEGLKNWPGIKRTNIKPQVDKFTFEDGHSIILLAEGIFLFYFRTSFKSRLRYWTSIICYVNFILQSSVGST